MSSRRLTQGPPPDCKCNLNITSFLIPPHLIDCLVSTRNSVSIVLLLWIMGGWNRLGVVFSYHGVGGATGSRYYLIVFSYWLVFLSFVLMTCLFFFKWVEHGSCCVCFFVYYLFSLSPVPLTRSYWGIEIVVSVM